jgi:hypothetical protein
MHGLQTTSAKIWALAGAGYGRTEIAKLLGIRYQHVRKVLLDAGIKNGLRKHWEAGRGLATPSATSTRRASISSKTSTPLLTPDEFRRGHQAFRDKERRDAMYKTAAFLVNHFWGTPAQQGIRPYRPPLNLITIGSSWGICFSLKKLAQLQKERGTGFRAMPLLSFVRLASSA